MFSTRITAHLTSTDVPDLTPLLAALKSVGMTPSYIGIEEITEGQAIAGQASSGATTAAAATDEQTNAVSTPPKASRSRKTEEPKPEPAGPTREELEVKVRAILTPLAGAGHGEAVSQMVRDLGFETLKKVPDAEAMAKVLAGAEKLEASLKAAKGGALD